MTNLRKAAEMAATDLEELISWHGIRGSDDKLMPAHNQTPEIKSAMETLEALRQALAQPEQEWDSRHPKSQALIADRARLQIKLGLVEQLLEDPNFETMPSDMEYWEPLHDKLKEALSQPEQEPVAIVHEGMGWLSKPLPDDTPLYTAPPKRKWVGLTDDETTLVIHEWRHQEGKPYQLCKAIEAKLKEKNT